jgi:hypothetical protein
MIGRRELAEAGSPTPRPSPWQSAVSPRIRSVEWLRSLEISRLTVWPSWTSNWLRTWRLVSAPTMTAKLARITNVSAADPPANRQRIGTDLYAENVPRAADRM